MSLRTAASCLVALVLFNACAPEDTGLTPASAPQIGKADSGDAADRTCRVILRSVKGLGEGYVDVDTAVLAAGGTPAVLFTVDGSRFFDHRALTAVEGGLAGFQRFRFALPVSGTPPQVKMIPFVQTTSGRLFDHNRLPGDLDIYVLARQAGYTVPLDEATCPAKGACEVPGVALQRVFAGVTIRYPTSIRQAPGDRSRVFVVQKGGTIVGFENRSDVTTSSVFLNIEARTYRTASGELGWEEGMLDLAFDPMYPSVPEAYVTYVSGTGSTMLWRLSRFRSNNGGVSLDPASEVVLIQLTKQEETHNGGSLAFGPDGFLYVSIGDGGGVLDPKNNAQNTNVLFGKILRLDIRNRGQQAYGIPADNPFASNGQGRPEIWSFGHRNPWRMSFDRQTGELWAAEVGQDAREEVNLVVKGGNYGYPNREAKRCTGKGPCTGNFIDPVFEIFHTNQQAPAGAAVGNSVTGGYVYRGSAIPELRGYYVYADFITGVLWGYRRGTANPVQLSETGQSIAAFGEDVDGELSILHHQGVGRVFKLASGSCKVPRPRDGRFYAFLSRDGIGNRETGLAYYQSILPGVDLASYTLAQWKAERIGTGATATSLYRNTMDLGFWRQMVCTTSIGRGTGGCCVTNWANEADVTDPSKQNLGTVCMDIHPAGYTRFYVFGPDNKLSPVAILDNEGEKAAPELCTPCHGGQRVAGSTEADLGSLWREFEPSLLAKRSGISDAQAEAEWFALNQAVLSANLALRSEAEGSPPDFNKWRANLVEYISHGIYVQTDPPVSRDVSDAAHVPASWKVGATAELVAAKEALYRRVVGRVCQECHRANTKNFDDYSNFESLSAQQDGHSLLEGYTTGDPTRLDGRALAFMPQAALMFNNLAADPTAQDAMRRWLELVTDPRGPTCRVTFTSNGPDWTQPGQDVWITGNVAELGNWSPTAGLKLNGSAFPTWTGTIDLLQGSAIEFKATVVDTSNGRVIWEAGVNRTATVPVRTGCTQTITLTWRNP